MIRTLDELLAWQALMTGQDDDIFTSVREIGERPAWHAHAACRGVGPEVFFPGIGRNPSRAREICTGCPVIVECAAAGAKEPDGVWGGLVPGDRSQA